MLLASCLRFDGTTLICTNLWFLSSYWTWLDKTPHESRSCIISKRVALSHCSVVLLEGDQNSSKLCSHSISMFVVFVLANRWLKNALVNQWCALKSLAYFWTSLKPRGPTWPCFAYATQLCIWTLQGPGCFLAIFEYWMPPNLQYPQVFQISPHHHQPWKLTKKIVAPPIFWSPIFRHKRWCEPRTTSLDRMVLPPCHVPRMININKPRLFNHRPQDGEYRCNGHPMPSASIMAFRMDNSQPLRKRL